MDSVSRFTDRVKDYDLYRPRYPQALVNDVMALLNEQDIMADIGAGTGLSSEPFAQTHTIYGVEPNAEMRTVAAKNLAGTHFILVDGTAEQTGLPNKSVDFIIAGQAFHWFDAGKTKIEFRRILKDFNRINIALMWNTMETNSPFLVEYEEFLQNNAKDYMEVRHQNIKEYLDDFFSYEVRTYPNPQFYDLDKFIGRAFSSSYAPPRGNSHYFEGLKNLFMKYQKKGFVQFNYNAELYLGSL